MPSTDIYGFEYETLNEAPARTLNGGLDGKSPILARQVETVVTTVESNLAARIAALEAQLALPRWVSLGSGAATGGAFTINVPAGVYSRLRLTLLGDLDGTGTVRCRVNGDSTAGLHGGGMIVNRASDGAETSVEFTAGDTAWRLCEWGTTANGPMIADFIGTDTLGLVAFLASGARISATATSHLISRSYGRLVVARQVTSLNIRPFSDAANLFADVKWWLEGHRES